MVAIKYCNLVIMNKFTIKWIYKVFQSLMTNVKSKFENPKSDTYIGF